MSTAFSAEQKEYLAGFLAAIAADQIPTTATSGAEPAVFGTSIADLCKEERWKHDENPLDAWDRLLQHAEGNKAPDAENTFRFKFHGLFHVAPAQDSFMVRLRIPAGELSSIQLHGIAEIASEFGAGTAHITTRANIQVRECKPRNIIKVLTRLQDLGLTSRGAGADNIRNITASPNSGFDPDELIDVRPFAKALHHYILNHRDMYGLPRKFNIAFDSGGSLSAAGDTNDICFAAVRVKSPGNIPDSRFQMPDGIYFRVQLGGITGHKDFAKDAGLLLTPSECVAVAAAMIRVFNENGCRTDRKKARLKYLLERWGVEKFVAETQGKLAFPLVRAPLETCEPRRPYLKHGWIGTYKQAQRGLNSIGIGIPVGRLTARQMHAVADIASSYGQGELRLTVWQNILVPHVSDAFAETARRALQRAGFATEATNLTGGIVACTGNKGCKYSATDTKGHAVALARRLAASGLTIGSPVNFHFTGCPHSCAQHYCGDIGFVGAKLADGAEGYHVVIGGGMGDEQGIAREIFKGVRAEEVPRLVEKLLGLFTGARRSGETFVAWTRRHSLNELQVMFST